MNLSEADSQAALAGKQDRDRQDRPARDPRRRVNQTAKTARDRNVHSFPDDRLRLRILAFCGATISFVVLAVRFIWMYPAAYLPRKLFPSIGRKDPMPPAAVIIALSWTGMRGIVSLAAALSIPLTLPSGEEFPFRNLLIFLTYVVILTTLLIPGTTLPALLRWLSIKDDGESRRDETLARLSLFKAGLRKLGTLKSDSGISAELIESTASRYERRVQTLESNLEPASFSPSV